MNGGRFARLGFEIHGSTATDRDGRVATSGQPFTFQRGGGAVTFISDAAISASLTSGAQSAQASIPDLARTAVEIHPSRPSSELNVCASVEPGRVTALTTAPGERTALHRPRGVAIPPFVAFETPRFGDHIMQSDAIVVSWRDARAVSLTLQAVDLDLPNVPPLTITPPLSADEQRLKAVSNSLIGFFGPGVFHDNQRIALVAILNTVENEPQELSQTFIAVTINEHGAGRRLELTPALTVVAQVPSVCSRGPCTSRC